MKKSELDLQQVTMYNLQNIVVDHITDNENGYREKLQLVQAELDSKDTQVKYHYLVELYDNKLIYEVRMQGEGTTYYQQNYTLSVNDEVEFVGEPVEVQREVNFVALEAKSFKRTKVSSNNDPKKEVKVSELKKAPCLDRVDVLIALESTKYTEKDKEWLLTQEAENIEKMFPNEPEKEETPLQVNADEVKKAVIEALTWEEIEKKMPKEKQDQLSAGLKLYKAQLADIIKGILENTDEGTWAEDDLKVMEFTTLEKVWKSVQKDVIDFSLNADGKRPEITDNEEENLLPTGIELEKEEASKN